MYTPSPHTQPRRRTAWRWPAGPLSAALALALLLAACGYGPDRAGLPGDARTLGIAVIRNDTFAGELDVRLQRELRQRFLRNPRIRIADAADSDLVLSVNLTGLTITRTRLISSATVTALTYSLTGDATLLDQRDRRALFERERVSATSTLNFNTATLETPAVRDEAIDDVLGSLAASIEARILTTF
ncbi:MAG: hypothetical protein HY342_08735 [Candidatus Lambdaproteobacteria bacterium]|nr:hypothetical protein [Candidatus Lambdaproteobacteria bacterium]